MSNSAFTPSVLTISATGTTGSGQGELNVITNPSAVTDLSGWTATGLTPSRDTSGSPLDPVIPTGFSISTSASGQTYVSTVTVPASLRNRKLKLEFYFSQSTASYKVDVLNSSSVRFPLTTDVSSVSNIPAISGGSKYTTYFDMDSGSTISVRFSSIASSGVLKFTQLIVGPGIQPQGAVVGEWVSYTPTFAAGFGTTADISFKYRRVGDSVAVVGRWTCGTTSATAATISLPLSLNVDSTKIGGSNLSNKLGTALRLLNGVNVAPTPYTVVYDAATPTSVRIVLGGDTSTSPDQWAAATVSGSLFSSGEMGTIEFTVPIAEWAGSGTVQLAQNDVEYASNNGSGGTAANTNYTTGAVYGPAGASIPAVTISSGTATTTTGYKVSFQSPIQAGDKIDVEVSLDSGATWGTLGTIGNGSVASMWQGNTLVGITWGSNDSTSVYVYFSNAGRFSTATYGTASGSWGQTSWRWRVRKSSAGAAVGFGIVQPGTSAGLVSASGLPGNTTGNAIAAGYVGEIISGTVGSVVTSINATGQYADGSISLGVGLYLVPFSVFQITGSSDTTVETVFNLKAFSGTATVTAMTKAAGLIRAADGSANGIVMTSTGICHVRVTASAVLKAECTVLAGGALYNAQIDAIQAVRIA